MSGKLLFISDTQSSHGEIFIFVYIPEGFPFLMQTVDGKNRIKTRHCKCNTGGVLLPLNSPLPYLPIIHSHKFYVLSFVFISFDGVVLLIFRDRTSSVGRAVDCRAGGRGFRTTRPGNGPIQALKTTEK